MIVKVAIEKMKAKPQLITHDIHDRPYLMVQYNDPIHDVR